MRAQLVLLNQFFLDRETSNYNKKVYFAKKI